MSYEVVPFGKLAANGESRWFGIAHALNEVVDPDPAFMDHELAGNVSVSQYAFVMAKIFYDRPDSSEEFENAFRSVCLAYSLAREISSDIDTSVFAGELPGYLGRDDGPRMATDAVERYFAERESLDDLFASYKNRLRVPAEQWPAFRQIGGFTLMLMDRSLERQYIEEEMQHFQEFLGVWDGTFPEEE